ncbi:MAG: contact-dependent growth inhibition system immunity protein, partial [Verrucomicrobiaceae bacterium]
DCYIVINTLSGYRSGVLDPDGKEIVLPVTATDSELGEALKQALQCSRTLKVEEVDAFFDYKLVAKNFSDWVDRMMLATGNKTKSKLFKTLKHCSVCWQEQVITIEPFKHLKSDAYEGIKGARVTISADSFSVELGKALRRSFDLCE